MSQDPDAVPGASMLYVPGSRDPDISDAHNGPLSPNEMLALYGLVRYPDLNDRELSAILGFKPSTLTAIKNRLKKNEMYKQVRMPIMEKLGSELLSMDLIYIAPTTGSDENVDLLSRLIKKTPEIVFSARESKFIITLGYFHNYAALRSSSIEMRYELARNGVEIEDSDRVIFPLSISRIMNNFDLSRILAVALPEVPDERLTEIELQGLDISLPAGAGVKRSEVSMKTGADMSDYPPRSYFTNVYVLGPTPVSCRTSR